MSVSFLKHMTIISRVTQIQSEIRRRLLCVTVKIVTVTERFITTAFNLLHLIGINGEYLVSNCVSQ